MMHFSTGTGLERVGVVGLEPGPLWASLKALDHRVGDGTAATLIGCLWMGVRLCKKNQKEEGPTGASPVAALMHKLVYSSEKRWTA